MSTRAGLIAFTAATIALFVWGVWRLIWEPGHIFSDLVGLVCSVLLLAVASDARRNLRRTTPTPRPVSEGCGSNHREDGNDL